MPDENERPSLPREKAVEDLHQYVLDTLEYMNTVKEFCDRQSKWLNERETELDLLRDIQERARQLNLNVSHVYNSQNKGKALKEYLGSLVSTSGQRENLEKELSTILKNTLVGMEKLTHFSDAVEKLAVTSLHVFTVEEEVVKLGMSAESVEARIIAARLVCSLLLQFKRNAGDFFLPSLHNVDVFVVELDKYIRTTENICKTMEKSSTNDFGHKSAKQPLLCFAEDLTEENMQDILSHVNELSDIRMDPTFRLVYLFQEKSSSCFIDIFSERQARMLQYLGNLEASAIQLDKMKLGSQISTIASSSVGVVGGVLCIVGLALAPITAGVSLGLTMGGVGLGITSGVNSAVTIVTEMAVNKKHQGEANEALQSYVEDVNTIQGYLEEISHQTETRLGEDDIIRGVDIVMKVGRIGKGIETIVDELPEIGQVATKVPAALSKTARIGLISLNALFLGLDILIICKESMSLAKGNKSEVSQFIRTRANLLRSELESWQRIHDSLLCGMLQSEKNQSILDLPLYICKTESIKNNVPSFTGPSDPVKEKPVAKETKCIIQ